MTEASSPPFDSGVALPLMSANRYICIRGGVPSAGVFMFALLRWFRSGVPGNEPGEWSESAPSRVSALTASAPSKLPAAAVKLIGAAASQSWKLLT